MTPPPVRRDAAQGRRFYETGLAHLHNGEHLAAQTAFERAVQSDDSLALAHYELGNCLRRRGDPRAAERALTAAIAQDPSLAEASISLAFLQRDQGRPEAAAQTLLALRTGRPTDRRLHLQAAGMLTDMGCDEAAATLYEQCLAGEPPVGTTHLKLGVSYLKLGRFKEAEAALLKAIGEDANADAAYLQLAHTRRWGEADRPLILRLEAALTGQEMREETLKCLHFALGKMYDDLGAYHQAFEHFQHANALHRPHVRFDRSALLDYVSAVQAAFAPIHFRRPSFPEAPVPVFVVGMPRSGTTLVERMLANHPQVKALGETERVDLLAQELSQRVAMPYPAAVSRLDDFLAGTLAAAFRGPWPREAPVPSRTVDKNPLNFLHLGLIAQVFPGAPIVHCRRNPLDTCLSIYFQHFAHPRNTYAYDLEDIGFFYRQYTILMAFWATVLPTPVHEVGYEDLVQQPEAVARRLLDAVGLEWHPDCLASHDYPGSISTASAWQARQPVYRESVSRSRHYADYLGPLRQALGGSSLPPSGS